MGGKGSRGIALVVRGKNLRFGNDDPGPVRQFLETAVGDHVSWIEPFHMGHVGLTDARFHVMNMRDTVLNEKDIRRVAVVLDGGGGDEYHILERVQEQAGIYELVGKERTVLILKQRA